MRPTRIPVLLLVPTLALALVACAGSSPGASTDGGGQSPAATAEPSTDDGGPGSSQDSGPGSGDAAQVAADLEPPNSSQISTTSTEGITLTVYESTDSPDSLKNFYENAIAQTGMQVFSTTNASGTYSWVFALSDGSPYGGSVTVGPASDGGSGASVIVIVSDGS